MSTLRISNIEAKADSSSPTVDEQLRFTNSDGDLMLYLDGRTAGITTVGINTTNSTIKFDANNNVMVTGIITATEFHGTLAVGTSVTYGDNEKAYFGTGLDLSIYHTGSHSYIEESGTGSLYIDSNQLYLRNKDTSNVLLYTTSGGEVRINHNGTTKLTTTSTGVTVAGTAVAGALDISGDIDVDGHTNLDNVSVAGVTTFSDNVNISSNKKLTLNNPGFEIYHNNSNAYLDNNVGHLYIRNDVDGDTNSNIYIQAKSGENGVSVGNDGSVVLFYDNNAKFQTTNTGTYITGIGTFTDKVSITGGSQNSMLTANQLIFDRAGTSYVDNSNDSGKLSFRIGSSYTVGLFIDSDGTVSIPSKLMHLGDTNTFMEFGSDTINFDTAGTERLRIGSDGLLTHTGDADFNVTGGELDIYSTGSGDQLSLRLLNSDTTVGNKIGIYFGPCNNVAGAYIKGVAESDFTSAANRDAGLELGTRLNANFLAPLKISAAGYVTKPNQPSFHVGNPNLAGYVSGQVWRCHANAIYSNVGSHYDNSNGRFTAPVAGQYFFFHWGMSSGSGQTCDVYSRKNGSRDQIGTSYNNPSGAQYDQFGCSYVRTLAAGDYVDVYTASGGVYNNTDGRHGGWGGWLIG